MPPNMPYLDKLRLSRLVLCDSIERAKCDFDRDGLKVALEVVEEEIHHIEWYNKITGGKA